MAELVLDLPYLVAPKKQRGHWAKRWRLTTEGKARTWAAAVQQHRPFAAAPDKVRIRAHYRVWNLLDEDNLTASLSATLDALKQNQPPSDRLEWRNGICELRGYFWDDAPQHLVLEKPTQEINRKDVGVTLRIEPLEARQAA